MSTTLENSFANPKGSLRKPLKNLDPNDSLGSEGFLRLTTSLDGNIKEDLSLTSIGESKIQTTDKSALEKLLVAHRGVHGEQTGTLIVR